MNFFLYFNFIVLASFSQKQDSLVTKKIKPTPLYKYYIYTEAITVLAKAAVINIEFNINHGKLYADYLKLFLGVNKSNDYLSFYPELNGQYNCLAGFFYVFTKNKRKINYEFNMGIGGGYGEPIARIHAYNGDGQNKIDLNLGAAAGLRYTFEKIPIHCRLWLGLSYNIITKKTFPLPSFSLGYGFKKLNSLIPS